MSLPSSMLALTLKESGYDPTGDGLSLASLRRWLEARQLPLPKPAAGQVLIRVGLATINPSDRHFIKGEYGQPRVKGAPAGFEGMGTVVAAGAGFYGGRLVGRRVSFAVTPHGSGAWADYACTEARNCIPLMAAVRDEDAAGLIVNPLTAAALFERVRRMGTQSFVMNAASSHLGQLLLRLAADNGSRPIAIVRREAQIQAMRDAGAQHVFFADDPDLASQMQQRFRVEDTRILLDAIGDVTAATAFTALPAGGHWVQYGKLATTAPPLPDAGQMIFLGKRIEGFWLVDWMRRTSLARRIATVRDVQKRFADGRWRTTVREVVPLRAAMSRLPAADLAGGAGKILLKP